MKHKDKKKERKDIQTTNNNMKRSKIIFNYFLSKRNERGLEEEGNLSRGRSWRIKEKNRGRKRGKDIIEGTLQRASARNNPDFR